MDNHFESRGREPELQDIWSAPASPESFNAELDKATQRLRVLLLKYGDSLVRVRSVPGRRLGRSQP